MADVLGEPVSAHDVAAVLRERLPGLPRKKLHKLLYYSQGHHLGTFSKPLFIETISAWDMGPVVGELWYREENDKPFRSPRELTEAQLNTVGYVVSRYGMLTGKNLEILTHGEDPWQRADHGRLPGGSARIEPEWIKDYFAADREEDQVPLDTATVSQWLKGADARRQEAAQPDSREEIQERLTSVGG